MIFTTAFFNIYSVEPTQDRTLEWRLEGFRKMLAVGLHIVVYTDQPQIFVDALCEFPHCLTIISTRLEHTRTYALLNPLLELLPEERNAAKDTATYLILMNAKPEFVARTAQAFVGQAQAWVDFNLPYIFAQSDTTLGFLRFLANVDERTLLPRFLAIPGCWSRAPEGPSPDRICWRFCGGFFCGDAGSILEFWKIAKDRLSLATKLTWEVNNWATWEIETSLSEMVSWYSADHNDTILTGLPTRVFGGVWMPKWKVPASTYDYPAVMGLSQTMRPMSASHVLTSDGRHWLNTRFVNYEVLPDGGYMFHDQDRVIRTENVLSELVVDDTAGGYLIPKTSSLISRDETACMVRQKSAFSEGWEDMRIWEGKTPGMLEWVATNIHCTERGIAQISVGEMTVSPPVMHVKQVIDSTNYEKNWIPLWNLPGAFLYKWHADCYEVFEIGVGRNRRVLHGFPLLGKCRGSSLFWTWTDELRLGVVHYNEGEGPRQYYHMLVVLRDSDGAVLGHTAPFRFLGVFPVEFCIGFWPDWEGQQLHFWISQMDRDPAYLVADYEQFRFFTVSTASDFA